MAITCLEKCEKSTPPSSSNSKGGTPGRLMKINFGADDIIATAKRGKCKKKSPYLHGEKIQLLSRITEKRFVHKKAPDFKSSFPLAVNLYKASSDEFKALKRNKRKVKKSVLTLPNEPAPMPQTCTVSDMNDSEYYNGDDENKKAMKKKLPLPNRKVRVRNKDFEFYDRDARHCSQMSIDLDRSSTDLTKNFEGDRKKVKSRPRPVMKQTKEEIKPHDVWAVLRNINRFQFKSSPRISEESFKLLSKKNTFNRKRNNRSGRRLIETHRTKEITYVANIQLGNRTPSSVSQSTSIDRVTVIENEDIKPHNLKTISPKGPKRLLDKNQNKNPPKYNLKSIVGKNNNGLVANNKSRVDKVNNTDKEKVTSSSSLNKESIDSSNYYNIRNNKYMECSSPCSDPQNNFDENCTLVNYYGLNKTTFNSIREQDKASPNESAQVLTGPKVLFNNGQRLQNRLDELSTPKRFIKPRLVTTMPSAATMPKLTIADIKRRLAHIKFPLVILGKDQLSSNVEVADYDPPQFSGLDEHIWPFMVEWNKKSIPKDKRSNGNTVHKRITQPREITTPKETRKFNNEGPQNKNIKEKRLVNGDTISKKKTDHKKTMPTDTNVSVAPQLKRVKPIRQLKDKMLKILYKKPSTPNLIELGQQINEQGDTTEKKVDKYTEKSIQGVEVVDASTETHAKIELQCKDQPRRPDKFAPIINRRSNGPPPTSTQMLHTRYPWARAKWASDFIDNIIRKMKDGAIYNQEDSRITTENKSNNGSVYESFKEPSRHTPTESTIMDSTNSSADPEQKITPFIDLTPDHKEDTVEYDHTIVLPGFDDVLPELEITTLNVNQIEVKHCLTNLMVKFDVKVLDPPDSEQILLDVKKSTSCIPLSAEGHTNVIKCNTTILNAVLPAELCSVIPRIMRKYVDSNRALLPPLIDVLDSNVPNILELSAYESHRSILPRPISFSISPKLRSLLEGRFSGKKLTLQGTCALQTVALRAIKKNTFNTLTITILLSKPGIKPLFRIDVHPSVQLIAHVKETESHLLPALQCNQLDKSVICTNQKSPCMALQVYTPPTQVLKKFDFTRMMETMMSCRNFKLNFNLSFFMQPLRILGNKEKIINVELRSSPDFKSTISTMTVTGNSLKLDSLYNGWLKSNNSANKSANTTNITHPRRSIGYQANSRTITSGKRETVQNVNKLKRKGYVKLYRKCKSTTNISGERSSTNLGKIINLDDFFQALGAGKNLSSVFDGRAGQIILSSLLEMKSWISEITPRQALLVLLLTNKKDTPNLVQFRPIILQGIAVNRITRATELDMEIEVIERENLKISQYEGISYLPASAANQNNLFEELCWIAKTTASDYQKPFDESSERLLKSLLEKRRKLNPSYLRVMARYVGLGLLKTPAKN